MSADTDRLIAQARANRDVFDQSLLLALAAALEAAEAKIAAEQVERRVYMRLHFEAVERAEAAEAQRDEEHERNRQWLFEDEHWRDRGEAAEAQRDEYKQICANALDQLHVAEAQRDTLAEGVAGIERLRDEAIKFYGECREEGSNAEAAIWDARASSYSRALGLLARAALARLAPPEAET